MATREFLVPSDYLANPSELEYSFREGVAKCKDAARQAAIAIATFAPQVAE